MSTSPDSQPTIGLRIVAVIMIAGGVAGIIGSGRLVMFFAERDYSRIVVPSCSIPLFAWTAWVGWGVWQGKAQFLRWAKILFAMQVLLFGAGGFAYEFSTGLSARVTVDGSLVPMPPPSHHLTVGAHFGSWLNLNLARHNSHWMVGVNLVPLIVLVYLFRTSCVGRSDVSPASEQEGKTPIENGPSADATR